MKLRPHGHKTLLSGFSKADFPGLFARRNLSTKNADFKQKERKLQEKREAIPAKRRKNLFQTKNFSNKKRTNDSGRVLFFYGRNLLFQWKKRKKSVFFIPDIAFFKERRGKVPESD